MSARSTRITGPRLALLTGEKICGTCKLTKQLAQFYRDKRTTDGRNVYCIVCVRAKARLGHYLRPEHIKAKKREKERGPESRAINRKATRRWRINNPQKKWAHHTLNNAIRDGRFKRDPCEKCGNPKSQGHHHDYSKPFDVRWLCQKCHAAEHRTSPEGIALREIGL